MYTDKFNKNFKVGVLGAGQLGKMMALAAGNWHLPIYFMDKSEDYPAAPFGFGFSKGDYKNYEDVYAFGKDKTVLTIEIEHVNTEALKALKKEGVKIHPDPDKLEIIKDKGLQKQFYKQHGIPTSPFELYEGKAAILEAHRNGTLAIPFVQKSRKEGYDGKGVVVINNTSDLENLLEGASMVEQKVDIYKEIAVIVAKNEAGDIKSYPTVEMEFHPTANLVEFLFSPAAISPEQEKEAEKLAHEIISKMDICGLLAVEMFIDQEGKILINEVAPRPHNSGHHTIESCDTSQFEQHLRAILNLPLGSTKARAKAAIMVNLLGEENHQGPTHYQGLAPTLAMEGVHPHLYGKAITRPKRKMGHVSIVAENMETARKRAIAVKKELKVISTKLEVGSTK